MTPELPDGTPPPKFRRLFRQLARLIAGHPASFTEAEAEIRSHRLQLERKIANGCRRTDPPAPGLPVS